jgi:hypothetical protein
MNIFSFEKRGLVPGLLANLSPASDKVLIASINLNINVSNGMQSDGEEFLIALLPVANIGFRIQLSTKGETPHSKI